MKKWAYRMLSAVVAVVFLLPCQAADVVRTGSDLFRVFADGDEVLTIATLSFKPNWGWMGVDYRGKSQAGDTTRFNYTQDDGKLEWALGVSGEKAGLKFTADVTAKEDVPLTYLAVAIQPGAGMKSGVARLTSKDGKTQEMPIALPAWPTPPNVVRVEFIDAAGKCRADIRFNQPADLHVDGNVRIKLISTKIAAGQKAGNEFSITLGQPVKIYASSSEYPSSTDHSVWFAFTPNNRTEAGAIGMQDWLTLPRSPLVLRGPDVLRDGKPIKIWGTNVEYSDCAPSKDRAEQRAAFFAKYGVNGVRLHKLSNPGWEGLGSTVSASVFDKDSLDRFDYFTNQLRQRGIVFGLSTIWDLKIFDGDRSKLVAYDELKKTGTTAGVVWFAKDVQDLHIEALLNLVTHRNPYSGLRYADDPALAYVEIQNEEDAFCHTTMYLVKRYPTYHKMVAEQFSDWLKAKYGSQDALVQAWGSGAMNTFSTDEGAFPDENLAKRNIFPVSNPWMWDNQGKTGPRAKRLQDTALFVFECQNNFYARVVKALQDAGYRGAIVGSNWQAGSTTGHLLNLASDAKFGMIDRHNYMGGAQGNPPHMMESGFRLANVTGLTEPGTGLLSSGMQQVATRPFVLSEWLAVVPSEWAAADTTLIAAYGLGLQGWDMSYHFASNDVGFTQTLGEKKFNNLTPVGFGLYPVLSRMVQRGDVQMGKPLAIRRLTLDQAVGQTYDFENTTTQDGDIKTFSGTLSHEALAVGPVLIDFTDTPKASTIGNWQSYKSGQTITSNTGQLKWTAPGGLHTGYFTINTPGTQGVVGFTGKDTFNLGDITFETKDPYAVILATAKSQKGTLATDKQVLIVAVARAHNTGMNMSETMIFDRGHAPVIVEPVTATLTFKRKTGVVTALDQDGMPTGQTYPLNNGTFQLDTGRDKTLYYLVEFK